jgi:hypothetical protein
MERLRCLHVLELQETGLVGSLPSTIGLLTKLSIFDLAFNKLDGPLQSEIGRLADLKVLYLPRKYVRGLHS